MNRVLQIGTDKSEPEIVLDFFAGSASFAHAVMDLNSSENSKRHYICVQIPEPMEDAEVTIADIGKERIRRAAKKIADARDGKLDLEDSGALDLGFKVFKLDRSNFKIWDGAEAAASDNLGKQLEMHVNHMVEASTPEDILYELLLKSGFPLTTSIDKRQMPGGEVYAIAGGALIICLEKNITPELIDAIAEDNPLQVICLDEGFNGNDQLKANAVQTFKARAEAEEREIVFRTV